MKRSQVAFLHLVVDFGIGFDLGFSASLTFGGGSGNGRGGALVEEESLGELQPEMGSLFSARLVFPSKNLNRGEHEGGVEDLVRFKSSFDLQSRFAFL